MDPEVEQQRVAKLRELAPGPELLALVERCRRAAGSPALAAAVLQAANRLLVSLEALRLEAVADVAGPAPARSTDDFSEADVAAELGCSTLAAERLVGLSRVAVLGPLVAVHRELRAGRASIVHLLVAADETLGLDDAGARAAVEAVLAEGGLSLPVPRFRDRLRRQVRRIDATAELRRRTRARRERRVGWWADRDGMGHLHVTGDLDRVVRAWEAIGARAAALPDDDRSADARRADTALDLLTGTTPSGAPVVVGRGEVLAVVAADALTAGSAGEEAAETRVAELVGAGPVLAGAVRSLAADHVVRRVVVDRATGAVLDTGATSRPRAGAGVEERIRRLLAAPLAGPPPATDGYVPSVALSRHVALRDRRCAMPGCSASAARCDLDHARPYPHGPTSADNLGALCRRHHRLKTRGHWTLRRDGPRTTWVTAAGRRLPGQREDLRWLLTA